MVHFPPGETLGAVSVVGEDAAADSTGERTRIAGTAPDIGNEPPPASAPPAVAERKAEAASGYIRTLDGWRAVAIMLVLACHARAEYGASLLARIAAKGGIGVQIFFVLSGFLITARLLRELDRHHRISLFLFYIRRIFRILPAYYACLAVLVVLGACGAVAVTRSELASCLLFFRNFLPTQLGGYYTQHFWSLAVEEHFYLIWPALLVVVPRRRLLATLGWLWAALFLWAICATNVPPFSHWLPDVNKTLRTDLQLDAMLCGCFAALVWRRHRTFLSKTITGRVWAATLCLAALAMLLRFPFNLKLAHPMIALLLTGTVIQPSWMVSRVLDARPMRWIGRISYSLYLWQQVFLVGVRTPLPAPLETAQHLPLSLLATFVFAALSYYSVEKPMVALGRRLASR